MEVGGGGERKKLTGRETSPDLSRLNSSQPNHQQQNQQRSTNSVRKAKIIYYLSRNGKLEHPHFMELLYLPHQQLRLKEVIDRLTILRGKGLHSLFSWSCKRSYKSGYVWNDLAENDVIYPADGIEYILKGSEIIPGSSEKFHHILPNTRQVKALPVSQITSQLAEFDNEEEEIEENEVEEEAMEEEARRTQGGIHTTRHEKRMSELGRVKYRSATRAVHHHCSTEILLSDESPPSSSSSDKLPNAVSGGQPGADDMSQRFDEDQEEVLGPGWNSVLRQLVSCGSRATKGRSCAVGGAMIKAAAASAAAVVASPLSGRMSSGGLHRRVVSRTANRAIGQDELLFDSENPPFRCAPVEDKEYFSGSILGEGIRGLPKPSLKKSSSYNEERSSKLGIGEDKMGETEDERRELGEMKAKCIPGRRKASAKQRRQQ